MTPQQNDGATRRTLARKRAAPDPWAHAFTILDAQAMGAPGRTSIYNLAKKGDLTLKKVGGRTMIDGDSLRKLLGVAA